MICDNCGTNRGVYKLMGGPGKLTIESECVVYHLFRCMIKDGLEYVAYWNDVVALYEEDSKSDPFKD